MSADWDVIIIGRSYAALSAALVLARARKAVLVIGDGSARNQDVDHVHGLLTRDHTPPGELLGHAMGDLERYESVLVENTHVDSVGRTDDGFVVSFGDRSTSSVKLILATGVNDDIPPIPGLADLWGRGVYTCPFCDGYEHADQPWALMGGEINGHQPVLLRTWASSVNVYRSDADEAFAAAIEQTQSEITLDRRTVTRLTRSSAGEGVVVHHDDGSSIKVGAVFIGQAFSPNNQIARELGCELDASGFVTVDQLHKTSVPGVFAIGDLVRPGPHQVVIAAADGVWAALGITMEMLPS